jgi:CIC family chloride channel protein
LTSRFWSAAARPGRAGHFGRAFVVGVLAGFIAVAFEWSLALAERGRLVLLDFLHHAPAGNWWGWAVLPAVGLVLGSIAGLLVQRGAPEAAGSGIPHIKGVLLHLRELRWARVLPVKFIGGVLSIGSGMSMGREGPTVQMGAAAGKFVADVVRLPPRLVPQLISCGAGAGLAAAFNAPLAGFLFVLEELHREMSALTFGGALIAALVSDIIARSLTGQLPSFSVRGYAALPLTALPAVAVLGIAGGLFGVAFNKAIRWGAERGQAVKRVPRWLLPGLGAAVCGLVGWWMPEVLGGGHSVAEALLNGRMQWTLAALAGLLVVKYLLTALCYGTGAPGGIFAPMLVMGAILGSILGRSIEAAWPAMAGHAQAFAVIGMAAIFTGSVRAPLTGMVLILEMTANYDQLLALGVACLTAYLAAEVLRDEPIYEGLLADDLSRRGPEVGMEGDEPRSVVIGVQRGSALEGRAIRDGNFPAACIVVGVERAGREVLPAAELVLLPGDHITVLVPSHETDKALLVVDLARSA